MTLYSIRIEGKEWFVIANSVVEAATTIERMEGIPFDIYWGESVLHVDYVSESCKREVCNEGGS